MATCDNNTLTSYKDKICDNPCVLSNSPHPGQVGSGAGVGGLAVQFISLKALTRPQLGNQDQVSCFEARGEEGFALSKNKPTAGHQYRTTNALQTRAHRPRPLACAPARACPHARLPRATARRPPPSSSIAHASEWGPSG